MTAEPSTAQSSPTTQFAPGQRIRHNELGEGIVIAQAQSGTLRALFSDFGEREVATNSLRLRESPSERTLSHVKGDKTRLRQARLACEAYALPLLASAPSLTAAPIDLLPHQIVLTHRIATNAPRRYLVADEVGLGKTIEIALLLRELDSRNELNRALIVVPAGLVDNWHRELNEVFHLDFEVFGSEGDITDRRSNAFAKHDRLIASIDTLKRRPRVARLLDAPRWDLVVFDEAHHLTASRSGKKKVRRTENYKLAEALKDHTRDLVLLSATPHQGDHFRFWMIVQLLNPTLFSDSDDMTDNRYRLNSVVFRRTKADACRPDGSSLFARRKVSTQPLTMNDSERVFYKALREYLIEGFDLAKKQGDKGRALGFVMSVFQKIAASSFAAVRKTLRKRLLTLTMHQAILKDQALDIEHRDELFNEVREMIRIEHNLPEDDALAKGQVDFIFADLKVNALRRLDEDEITDASDSSNEEDIATQAVKLALPQERERIQELLAQFPQTRETKVRKLLEALDNFWRQNPHEKIVIFATYLATVDLIGREIEAIYPGHNVVVLRGGDHGAKLAAERRFKKPDGPRVLVCTAAGREGINLQVARILFNFDLPWNPMDIEQRIGRIHRYGQQHTAQVYNLVLSDTIEGRIFLLLKDKLEQIGRTLGKVDEQGNIAEDLRIQILGQLSERLTYDKLFREALSDPLLVRTKEELEAATSNANEARKVMSELFQDLESFSIEDYKPHASVDADLARITQFFCAALSENGQKIQWIDDTTLEVSSQDEKSKTLFTTKRELARSEKGLELIGLDHPQMLQALHKWQALEAEKLGVAVLGEEAPAVATWWMIDIRGKNNEQRSLIQFLAVNREGQRLQNLEREGVSLFERAPARPALSLKKRTAILNNTLEPMILRELQHQSLISPEGNHSAKLICWLEISAKG